MLKFSRILDHALVEQHATRIASWIFSSGPAFFSALFGSADAAQLALGNWLHRSSSEFSVHRATLALHDDQPVAIVIGLPGPEVAPARRADLLALVQQTSSDRRPALMTMLKEITELAAPVSHDDYYIRTVAVDEAQRGRGFGRQIVEQSLSDGRVAGFRRFRLDVDADNAPALHLYESLGFERIHEGSAPRFGLHMFSMLRQSNE